MNNIQKNFKAKSALRKGHGGSVKGPGGPTDDKVGPVMLSDDEYVLPADTTAAIGVKQLDALRAMTHTPAGLRRTGNNPERAAMMQKQYDQPVTGSAIPKQTGLPLPLPENAPKADMRPEKAFMYRDNLGESLKGLRDKIPGLADGGMVESEKKKNSWGFNDTLRNTDTTRLANAGVQTVISAAQKPPVGANGAMLPMSSIPEAIYNSSKPGDSIRAGMAAAGAIVGHQNKIPTYTAGSLPSNPNGLINTLGNSPLHTGGGGLRTPPPPTNSIATAPGGNTLPATRNSGAPMRTGTAPHVERDMGRAQVVGDGKPRITGPASATAAATAATPKPSMLGKVGSALKYGGGALGMGFAGKDIYDNGLNLSNGTDLALSAGTLLPNKYVAGASMAGLAGKGIYQALPDEMQQSIKGAFTPDNTPESAPAAPKPYIGSPQYIKDKKEGAFMPGMRVFEPAREAQQRREIGTNALPNGPLAPEQPKVVGGAYAEQLQNILKGGIRSPLRASNKPSIPLVSPSIAGISKPIPVSGPQPTTEQQSFLDEAGVPRSVQNGPALEQGPATLATAGKGDQFQNLGTYGGDANIYGRASDPARPGRINDFVGIGGKTGAVNTISGNDAQVQRGRELLAQDAAQRSGGLRSANGRDPNKLYIGTADGELGSTEQRFGAMRRELQQKFGSAGDKYLLGKHMQKLNEAQSTAMAADAETAQKADEAALLADTNRYTSDNQRDSYKYTSDTNLKIAELEAEATRGDALRTATKEALAGRVAAEKSYADDVAKMSELYATDDMPKQRVHELLTRLPQQAQDQMAQYSSAERQEVMSAIITSATAGRNMSTDRDTGAMIQNALIAGLGTGLGGKVLGAVKGSKGNMKTLATSLAAMGLAAYFTPKNKPSNLASPMDLTSTGQPVLRDFSATDGFTTGFADTAWNAAMGNTGQDEAGNPIDLRKLTQDQISGLRSYSTR